MKLLSLKLNDNIFMETEKITAELDIARNRYINDALEMYNLYNKKKLLKSALYKASKLTRNDAMSVLAEFENIADEATD